jgi:hypothetical protein
LITPGGSPGKAFTKSATSRFNNNQVKAAQGAMPMNALAQQSLRKQSSKSNPNGMPLAPTQNSNDLLGGAAPMGPAQAQLPTGGPGLAPEAAAGFDPAVFQESIIDNLVGKVRTQEFINSPRVKDAASSVRLKNFFNNTNPNRTPDSRNLLQQVLDRTGLK